MQFLGREARKALFEIESHLVSEHANCACACAVVFLCALGEDAVEQVEILFHIYSCFVYSFCVSACLGALFFIVFAKIRFRP